MARDDHRALRDALARHPRGGHRRQLPAHAPVPEPDALALRHRGVHGAGRRLRGAGGRDPADDARAGERVADQSRTTASSTSSGSPTIGRAPPREDGHRRHLRHALQPAAARVGRRPRHALRHQVPRRPQRPAGRRGAGLAPSWWARSAGCRASPAPSSIRSPPICSSAGSRPSRCAWSGRTRTPRRSPSSSPAHPRIAAVHYAGPARPIPSTTSPSKQMRGFGGVVSFEVAGDLDAATRVVDACTHPATSRPRWAGWRASSSSPRS